MRGCALALAVFLTVAASSPQENAQQTFRTGVDIVQVDLSVLDANRQPVRGLTAADFTVLEDGKPRPIVAFTPVDIPTASHAAAGTAAWVTEVAPDVVNNDLPREGRLVVILFDQSIRNAQWPLAKRAAKAAVETLGPNDLAAVVHVATGRPQNFTRDRSLLFAAIDAPSMGLGDHEVWLAGSPSSRGAASSGGSTASRGECPLGKCTLEAITRIANSLRNLPRRKSLIFITEHLTIQEFDDHEVKRLRQEMFRALDVANLTVYPVDPLALETLAMNAARISGARPTAAEQLATNSNHLVRQGTLKTLADRTGGRVVVNSNDPEKLVPAIFAESSSYYSLGFESADRENKGRFHEIEVRVNRRDVSVQSRRGHYAGALPGARGNITGPPGDLVAALSEEWPKADTRLAIAASAFGDPAGRRPIAAITVAASAGSASTGMLVAAFDSNGRAVNHHWQVLDLTNCVAGRTAFDLFSRLPLEPGRYEIRAAVRGDDGRAGTVFTYLEVPDFKKAPLSMSGVAIDVKPARIAAPANAFDGLIPIVPTARRELMRSDEMTAFVRIYAGSLDKNDAVQLSATVQDASGRTVVTRRETLEAPRFTKAHTADYRLELKGDTLEPGEYLLSIEATGQKRTVRRDVRFTVR